MVACRVQRFKLLISLAMESHIKVTDLLSVKIKNDITVCFTYLIVRFKWNKTIQFGNRVLSIPLLAFPLSNFVQYNVKAKINKYQYVTSIELLKFI
jgi:hypothetical protein